MENNECQGPEETASNKTLELNKTQSSMPIAFGDEFLQHNQLVCYNETSIVTQKVFSVICNFCIITINGEHSAGIRDMILASIGTR